MRASSSQFQRRQAEQREDDRDDQEAGDHLRLAPANQLEVVVERRHLEDARPVSLNEATWMITDSASITNTPPTIDEQDFLLDEQRHGAERAAERRAIRRRP